MYTEYSKQQKARYRASEMSETNWICNYAGKSIIMRNVAINCI
jgi:hypothetical protein